MMTTPSPTPPERLEFVASDPSEAREFLDQTYGWRITGQRPDPAGGALVVSMVDACVVSSAYASAPGELSYEVQGGDYVVIDTLFDGTFEFELGETVNRYGPGDLYIANHPTAEFSSHTHDIRVLTTILPCALLSEVAGADPGRDFPPVEFLSYTPIPGRGQRWRAASRFIDGLLNDPDAGSGRLVVGPAARMVAATALATFPNTAITEPTTQDRHDAHRDTLRRAIAFIETNPDLDISIADIARAAYVTPRAIQIAFRRQLGTTPLAFLRQVRLEHARQQLKDATPGDGTTVTRTAIDWGFANPGRFAEHYRAAYGELPSHTLAR
jgi:AraC-like DNA-binding protein